jgi:hypothetical protein
MKFQHVLLMYSDLEVLPPPQASSIYLFLHFLFFTFLEKSVLNVQNLFYTFLTISYCENEEDERVLC